MPHLPFRRRLPQGFGPDELDDAGHTTASKTDADLLRRRRQFGSRRLVVAVAVAAVWFGTLRVPGGGALTLSFVGVVAAGFAALAVGMLLGGLGIGVFFMLDRRAGRDKPGKPPRL